MALDDIVDEIRATLEDLIIDAPEETAALMRARTFARGFH